MENILSKITHLIMYVELAGVCLQIGVTSEIACTLRRGQTHRNSSIASTNIQFSTIMHPDDRFIMRILVHFYGQPAPKAILCKKKQM